MGEVSNIISKKEGEMDEMQKADDDYKDYDNDYNENDDVYDDERQRRRREQMHKEKLRTERENDNNLSDLCDTLKSETQIKKLRSIIDKIKERCLLNTDDLVKLLNEYNATKKSSPLVGNISRKSFLENLLNIENEENVDRDKSDLGAAKPSTSIEEAVSAKRLMNAQIKATASTARTATT